MIPVFSVVGSKSNVGKTTVLCNIIRELKARGYRVATIKHDLHGFDIDHPGKDTWLHAEAGADIVSISSSKKMAIIEKLEEEYTLDEMIEKIKNVDIIITEGYPENEEWSSDELAHLYYPNNLDKLGETITPDGNTVIEVKWHMSTITFVRIYSQSKTKVANAYLSMQIENNGHNISNWETILGDETTSDITIHFYVNQLSHKQYKEGIEYRSCYLYELKVVE